MKNKIININYNKFKFNFYLFPIIKFYKNMPDKSKKGKKKKGQKHTHRFNT